MLALSDTYRRDSRADDSRTRAGLRQLERPRSGHRSRRHLLRPLPGESCLPLSCCLRVM